MNRTNTPNPQPVAEVTFAKPMRGLLAVAAIATTLGVAPLQSVLAAAPAAPAYAQAVGYTMCTFNCQGTNFTSTTVDMTFQGNLNDKGGFNFYPYELFNATTLASQITLNSNGSATIVGPANGANSELASVTPVKQVHGQTRSVFVGTAFGGGGYFEATLSFNPANTPNTKLGWPSFWMLPIEGDLLTGQDVWPAANTPNYHHSIELDIFEYDAPGATPANYGGSMHDWYGISGSAQCPNGLCGYNMPYSLGARIVPAGTDFTQPHRYGALWVPATSKTQGYVAFYFDGVQMGAATYWNKFNGTTDAPIPDGTKGWEYGHLDDQHMFFVLGTGAKAPMTIYSVNAWQATAANNVVLTK